MIAQSPTLGECRTVTPHVLEIASINRIPELLHRALWSSIATIFLTFKHELIVVPHTHPR